MCPLRSLIEHSQFLAFILNTLTRQVREIVFADLSQIIDILNLYKLDIDTKLTACWPVWQM